MADCLVVKSKIAPRGRYLHEGSTTVGPLGKAAANFLRFAIGTIAAITPTVGFAGGCSRITVLEEYWETKVGPDGAICETFVGLNNTNGVFCYWSFPFRDIEAVRAFDDIWNEVNQCKVGTQSTGLNPVNHPDSYLLKELFSTVGIYRVARKDKGQLNQTLVFLSVELGA